MAKVRIPIVKSDLDSKIIVKASQSGRFLKVVNNKLKSTVATEKHEVVQNYFNDAIRSIKEVLSEGIDGASTNARYSTYIPGTSRVFIEGSGSKGRLASFSRGFQDLAYSTIKAKARHGGSGLFYRMKGELAGAMATVQPPKVRYDTYVYSDNTRRKGSVDTRVDFKITMKVGDIGFPFDDMVRRPMLSRSEYDAVPPTGHVANKTWVLTALEFGMEIEGRHGTINIPPRPWIVKLSATLGEHMFDRLYET